ncbi:hypothetical protein [Sporisorium scitamineum]|uniref:Uncharacterized protein n=1 Tax=Sporisorium scitamineum TaxID=49012 RepID=A0A0F7RTM0_9BASI|nr:hypothetical protein [Sporisorium scitamineum]
MPDRWLVIAAVAERGGGEERSGAASEAEAEAQAISRVDTTPRFYIPL